jgi:hypothetical protein
MDINNYAQDLWPSLPILQRAQCEKGWTTQFISLEDGTRPALNDLADRRRGNAKPKDLDRLDGIAGLIAVSGIEQINKNMFLPFKGEDAFDGMCEVRLKAEMGIRVLGFKADGRVILLASAFRKPAQPETPKDEKARAREILRNFYR